MSEVRSITWNVERVKVDSIGLAVLSATLTFICVLVLALYLVIRGQIGEADVIQHMFSSALLAFNIIKYPLCAFVGWRVGRAEYFRVEV